MKKCWAVAVILLLLSVLTLVAQVSFNPEQQKQYAKCTVAAEKVQAEVRDLARLANGAEFSAEKAKQQTAKVRDAYTAMHEQHKTLVEPLVGDQAKAVEARKARMDQACMRIRASLKELDLAVALPNPDPTNVARHAQAIELAMNEWQKEHQGIGNDMGVAAK